MEFGLDLVVKSGCLWEEKAGVFGCSVVLKVLLRHLVLKTMSWWFKAWGGSICGKSVENFGDG